MSTSRYAETTRVTPDRSRSEIERTLERYGAAGFAYATQGDRAMIEFVAHDRRIRLLLELPDPGGRVYHRTPTGQTRTALQAEEAWKKDVRQRWRALALVVKAKLEAVSSGIVSFEDEWAMHTVLPDGRTVAEHVRPAIVEAYESGNVPELLPNYTTTRALEAGS